ncbi:nuclear factor erythroid 2-related factor 2a isoform X1 [Corythoichthys intestinalis]|uniref:nuclear factor erythroid 2-related factor 2a isoform X1 n=2 Tax=Corythoichthys intestinalis TaxID=161448 RepID=UPI0025A4DE48|nr:nuclear factor erythroid 2-related factor 2a isoform X1 [Corythoichthys intestinalis]XP_057708160.1 nuclear factor erythroid 2-related factor 2a isoform X1 [Corythoichthys intestinalis]
MMTEMEVMHSGQQDMELIDILWRQDIDLGARREVFDYSHRQKAHELQRQQELAEEKRLHLLREQEKALLAQLQLDEETGEYVPRLLPSAPLQSTSVPLEVAQDVSFTQQSAETLSFDECLQLLAETFPVEENEDVPVGLETSASSCSVLTSPEQPSLAPLTLSPDPLTAPQSQKESLDIEQAWMELLSLPELQQCLTLQIEEALETTAYPLLNSTEAKDPNYSLYPMSSPGKEKNTLNMCPTVFINTFDSSVPNITPADNANQIKSEVPQLNTHFNLNSFCNTFYPDPITEGSSSQQDLEEKKCNIVSDVHTLYSLSPDTFERGRCNVPAEVPDLDSGLSSSPHACSPGKSLYGDEGFDGSDSEMDEMEQNPGSAKSDYSEMFSLNFQPDDDQRVFPLSTLTGHLQSQEDEPTGQMTDLSEDNGHCSSPFTKDKRKRGSDSRLSRDEQRAKALKIPFSIDMIINLPVDDYNELISKNQLNETQLALVRDIRRRGKNKVAAQNCRKRKMENIVGLENDLDSLKEEKVRLLGEKSRNVSSLREMKRKLNSLYLDVFSMLKDEDGNSISPSDFSLQQSTEGSVFLVPRTKKTIKS